MRTIVKEKLVEVVDLLNNPETTVLDKELKEKLLKIVGLLESADDPVITEAKLEKVAELVGNAMVDPDIEIEYITSGFGAAGEPTVLVTYVLSDYNKPTRKIRLNDSSLQGTPEEIMDHITASITEFKSEIDSVQMG